MSHFTQVLCRDVRVCFFDYLGPKDQASLRAVSKESSIDFNHAAQRGYVPVVVCEEYVEDVDELHQDGEDGHPKLHVAPGDRKNLFAPANVEWWDDDYKMQRSEKDTNATLIINVAKMLGKGETKLQDYFLYRAPFKAVHLIGTEELEEIGNRCFAAAKNLVTFTMSTPCPKLKNVGYHWLSYCSSLKNANTCFNGCSSLEDVGAFWMSACESLEVANVGACVSLKRIGYMWLETCPSLRRVVLPSDTELPDDIVERVKEYLEKE